MVDGGNGKTGPPAPNLVVPALRPERELVIVHHQLTEAGRAAVQPRNPVHAQLSHVQYMAAGAISMIGLPAPNRVDPELRREPGLVINQRLLMVASCVVVVPQKHVLVP